MQHLKTITNSIPEVAAKVNYFINVFNHFVNYAGTEWHLELETPLSLLEKVLYQLKQNQRHNIVYLENYFANELFDHPGFWDKYSDYKNVVSHIQEFKLAKSKKEKQVVADRATFHTALKKVITAMIHKTPGQRIDSLISVINCEQSLAEHEHTAKLSTLARMMVSDGYFTGKTRNEIQQTVKNVFEKRLDQFPFPVGTTKAKKRQLITSTKLENQVLGFMSLMQDNSEKGLVLMKAFGTFQVPDQFYFKYNGVEFHGKDSARVLKLKEDLKDDEFLEFFEGEPYLLISSKITWFDKQNIPKRFKLAIQSQLDFFTYVINTHLTLDDSPNFLILNPNWTLNYGMMSTQKYGQDYRQYKLEDLEDNPYRILSKVRNSPAKDWLILHEPLLVAGFRQEGISMLWQYLEALLPKDADGENQVKALISEVILLNEKMVQQRRILNTFYSSINIFSLSSLGLSHEDFLKIHKNILKGKIDPVLRKMDYPFVQELISDFDLKFDEKYFVRARSYYYSILTEAYEIRNFDVHSGKSSNKASIKIKQVLPGMISRLRWLIFDEIKSYPHLPFELIIDQLQERGGLLWKQRK